MISNVILLIAVLALFVLVLALLYAVNTLSDAVKTNQNKLIQLYDYLNGNLKD